MSQFFVDVSSGNLPPEVPILFTEDIGTATPAANNLNVLGGTGVTTSGSGSTVLINVVNGGFTWIETSVSLPITAQQAVFCNAALTISLPATAGIQIGAQVIIYADTSSAVVIQANTGQFIEIGGSLSTAAGTATSNAQGNIAHLVFKPSDLTWHSLATVGTFTTA